MIQSTGKPQNVLFAFEKNKFLGIHEKLILEILQKYNPRVSEIINAKWSNFFPGRFLILDGLKHSSNVIIRDTLILEKISKLEKHHNIFIFPFTSYQRIASIISRYYSHLFSNIKIKKNRKLTHAWRYLNISGVDNEEKIRDILSHRSVKSGQFYKNKLKGSKNV